jgi:1-acyl-sn-glycerol-3-phosphate acyltransferase
MIAAQHPVALAMTAFVRTRFRLRPLGLENLRIEPGTIIAVSHRSDFDVPVLVSALYPRWSRAVAMGAPWPTFAADDHAFMRGFLAGYPEAIPLALRRLLWPIRVGGVLERRLQCVPVRLPTRMRLMELLAAEPDRELDGQLPAELTAALRRRAGRLRRPEPRRAVDVLGGAYADLLWTDLERAQVTGAQEVWRAHLRAAVDDFRRLVAALRGGGLVVIFPEGELSEEGEIGPLQSGLGSLARRGRVRLVQPIAISYDPLAQGRTRAYVSVGPALEPERGALTRAVTAALRTATPLTVGQVAASALRTRRGSPAQIARDWIERAHAEGRPVDPALEAPGLLDRVLDDALRHARRRGPDVVRRLARELESAHTEAS